MLIAFFWSSQRRYLGQILAYGKSLKLSKLLVDTARLNENHTIKIVVKCISRKHMAVRQRAENSQSFDWLVPYIAELLFPSSGNITTYCDAFCVEIIIRRGISAGHLKVTIVSRDVLISQIATSLVKFMTIDANI